MNQEAAMKELTGQTLKLAEQFTRKEQILENIDKEKVELEEIKLAIKNIEGIIQTLQFLVQTNGFENMQGMGQQPVAPPKMGQPVAPTRQPVRPKSEHMPTDEISKALSGG